MKSRLLFAALTVFIIFLTIEPVQAAQSSRDHISTLTFVLLMVGLVAFFAIPLALKLSARGRRAHKIEAAARQLGFPFRRYPEDLALIAGAFVYNLNDKILCNIVEAVREDDLKITLFDNYSSLSEPSYCTTLTRVESPMLPLPRICLDLRSLSLDVERLGGRKEDIEYLRQQRHLEIEGGDGVMFVSRSNRRMKAHELAAFVERGKRIFALYLEANPNRSASAPLSNPKPRGVSNPVTDSSRT